MLSRVLFACVCLGLYSTCSSLSCRWMDHKFSQFSGASLDLLDMMADHQISEDEEVIIIPFPHYLYRQASRAPAEDKVAFTVQILKEVSILFEEEDHVSSSWEEVTEENFLSVINQQADELHSCVGGHRWTNTRLHMYFKRLSRTVFGQMGHSHQAWELVLKEIKAHLIKADHLVSSLVTRN